MIARIASRALTLIAVAALLLASMAAEATSPSKGYITKHPVFVCYLAPKAKRCAK